MNDQDREALDILQEECAEVIQAASKIKRWGPDSNNRGANPQTNLDALAVKLGDVLAMIDIVQDRFSIGPEFLQACKDRKREKLRTYSAIATMLPAVERVRHDETVHLTRSHQRIMHRAVRRTFKMID